MSSEAGCVSHRHFCIETKALHVGQAPRCLVLLCVWILVPHGQVITFLPCFVLSASQWRTRRCWSTAGAVGSFMVSELGCAPAVPELLRCAPSKARRFLLYESYNVLKLSQ